MSPEKTDSKTFNDESSMRARLSEMRERGLNDIKEPSYQGMNRIELSRLHSSAIVLLIKEALSSGIHARDQ